MIINIVHSMQELRQAEKLLAKALARSFDRRSESETSSQSECIAYIQQHDNSKRRRQVSAIQAYMYLCDARTPQSKRDASFGRFTASAKSRRRRSLLPTTHPFPLLQMQSHIVRRWSADKLLSLSIAQRSAVSLGGCCHANIMTAGR